MIYTTYTSSNLTSVMNNRMSASVMVLPTKYLDFDKIDSTLSNDINEVNNINNNNDDSYLKHHINVI